MLVTSARDLARAFGSARCHLLDAAGHFFAQGGARLWVVPATGALEQAFARLDDLECSLVASPGQGSPAVVDAGARYCEQRGDRFFLADAPVDAGAAEIRSLAVQVRSAYAALFVPWLDPASPAPPSGFVAGALAARPVWQPSPVLRGAPGALPTVSESDRPSLAPLGVNLLGRSRTGEVRIGAAQTLSPDPEWKYVNVRRTAIFIEHSIDAGTQWAAFEPNAEPLWARLRRDISAFLETYWRGGAFQGAAPDDAYFVQCDRTTMTQSEIDSGRVNVIVGFAPLRPAEFVVLRIGLWAARDDPDP